jgi:hypothetical protein
MDKKQQQQQQHPLFESINQSINRSTKYAYREVSHVWTVFKAGNLVEAEAEFPIFYICYLFRVFECMLV